MEEIHYIGPQALIQPLFPAILLENKGQKDPCGPLLNDTIYRWITVLNSRVRLTTFFVVARERV
jgi:hypothetical protein